MKVLHKTLFFSSTLRPFHLDHQAFNGENMHRPSLNSPKRKEEPSEMP
jgi:hypothetical protein